MEGNRSTGTRTNSGSGRGNGIEGNPSPREAAARAALLRAEGQGKVKVEFIDLDEDEDDQSKDNVPVKLEEEDMGIPIKFEQEGEQEEEIQIHEHPLRPSPTANKGKGKVQLQTRLAIHLEEEEPENEEEGKDGSDDQAERPKRKKRDARAGPKKVVRDDDSDDQSEVERPKRKKRAAKKDEEEDWGGMEDEAAFGNRLARDLARAEEEGEGEASTEESSDGEGGGPAAGRRRAPAPGNPIRSQKPWEVFEKARFPGQVIQTFDASFDAPREIYVPTGNQYVSLNVKALCKKAGIDCREVFKKVRGRGERNYPPTRVGIIVPANIYAAIKEKEKFTSKSRAQTNEKRASNQEQLVMESFQRNYPFMPQEERENIYTFYFEKGAGRIGTRTELTIEKKVSLCVSQHILYNYTNFDELYRSFVGGLYRFPSQREQARDRAAAMVSDKVRTQLQRWQSQGRRLDE